MEQIDTNTILERLGELAVDEAAMLECMTSSFRNFHARGLDYICLKRSPEHTVKVYLLDGDVTKLPEVVCPHDHRYDFHSTVLAGKMANQRFEVGSGTPYNVFDFHTPLLGGKGFTWAGEIELAMVAKDEYTRGQRYFSPAEAIHTISIRADQTALVLDQYADKLSPSMPSTTFIPEREPPSLDGLYERFTEDQFAARLRTITNLARQQ